ncbi:MAG: hypothetical protein IT367_00240 [Candidatus Hydrogenedentes bacterium]|nr:hypothetical protein [Candidatus Hydrogenedentota bacterium]
MNTRGWIIVYALIALSGVAVVALKIHGARTNPKVAMLFPEGGAQWIRTPNHDALRLHWDDDNTAGFRTRFTITNAPTQAILTIRPFRKVAVYFDGNFIGRTSDALEDWKRPYEFDLAQSAALTPGEHELFLSVMNRMGPPVVLAYCDALNLRTDASWECKDGDRAGWRGAVLASARIPNPIGEQIIRSDKALIKQWKVFLPVFLIVFCWVIACARVHDESRWYKRIVPSASGFRWLLLAAWALLAANNIVKLPFAFGFDVPQHLEYIEFMLRKGSIPFANNGWQMFQSPFYYMVSLPLYVVFCDVLSVVQAPYALRIVPLLCGALQIELCFRALRRVYPTRQDLQAIGTLLGGFVPMNVYQSQYMGNEPLAAVLSSVVVVMAITLSIKPELWSNKRFAIIGVLTGLALLTKVSALLIFGPLVLLMLYVGLTRSKPMTTRFRDIGIAFAVMFSVAFAVCSWYYIRNWMHLGAPFVGGWDPGRGYAWWQEPGYRTTSQFFRFGDSLFHPFFAAIHGIWDGLYSTLWIDGYDGCAEILARPFWNFDFALACLWFSLLPTAALIIGAVSIAVRPASTARNGQLLCAIYLATYFAAILMMMLEVPSYSTLKATYALGALCCFAVVGAQGFDYLTRKLIARALVYGVMACWFVSIFAGYFVL